MKSRPSILLVNPNRMRPPVSPIGLEYVAHDLAQRGYDPVLCDLSLAEDWRAALTAALDAVVPFAIGFTVRNIDDAYFASQDFVLATTTDIIRHAKAASPAPVVLGGIGFSCAPEAVLEFTGADYGIRGDGEGAFADLLDCLANGDSVANVAGAVFHTPEGVRSTTPKAAADYGTYAPSRRFADNARYFAQGGQLGLETKRGCPNACIYCFEPFARGSRVRAKAPAALIAEVKDLLDQGIDVFHLCDSEFNLPIDHARAFCETLVHEGLSQRLRWYVYAAPVPFDAKLAAMMKRAGCQGIDFGVDHVDPGMLRHLGRAYSREDVAQTARVCRESGIDVMFDMLFGGPGETRESIAQAIDFLRPILPGCVGLSCGVRVYPNTPLAGHIRRQGPMADNPHLHGCVIENESLLRPIFYVDSAVGGDINRYVASLVRGDDRFLHADPDKTEGNYNYNDNSTLSEAIRAGDRGAYWHILQRAKHKNHALPA